MGHSSTQPSGHLSGHASESHRSDPSRSGHRSIAEGRWQSVGLGVLRYADGVNTYAVRTEPGHIVIIDPGRGRWWHHLDQIGVTMVDAVVITHLHRDGVCGLYRPGPLADEYRGDIFLPTGDLPLADDIKTFWANYQAAGCPTSYAAPRQPLLRSSRQRLRAIGADSEICFGKVHLCAIATPGHSRGALSYLLNCGDRQAIFCGDAAHAGATIHQPYHLEWDHWTPEGVLQAWYGLERLRSNRIDLLLPSHGNIVRREPRDLLARLQDRLLRLVSAKTAIAAGEPSRWYNAETVAEGVRQILPHLYAFGGNSYLLASYDGSALIVDPVKGSLPALERLVEHTGLRPDVATATHYHYDHSNGLLDLRKRYGAQIWLHPWVAEPLRDRNRLDVPFLPLESVDADRVLPEEGRLRWREYDLGVRPYPGQTWWHCAFDTLVDDRRVLISGDNFQPPSRWNGTGGFCAFNGSRFREGFARSARVGLQIAPDIVCNGHQCLYHFDARLHEAILAWCDEAETAVADVCPGSAWRANYDPRVVRFEPFAIEAIPGGSLDIHVVVTNYKRTSLVAEIEPVPTADLAPPTPSRRRTTVPAGGSRRLKLRIDVAETAKTGRQLLALDVTFDKVVHPEACVALVDVKRKRRKRTR